MNKSRSQTIDFSQWRVSYGQLAPHGKRPTIAHGERLPVLHHQTERLRGSVMQQSGETSSEKRKFTDRVRRFQYLCTLPTQDSEEMGKAALEVIESFSKIDNNFTELFVELHRHIRAYCSYDMDTDEQMAKQLRAVQDSGSLLRNGQSLRKIVMGLKECYDQLGARKDELIAAHQAHIRDLEEVIVGKNTTINRLKERVQYYVADTSRNLREQHEQLQRKFKELEDQLGDAYEKREDLSSQLEIREKERDFYKREMITLKDVVEGQRERIRLLEQAPHKLDEVKERLQRFRNMLDQIFVKAQSLSEELDSLKAQNERLMSERVSMLARSAVQFDELTPRPNYQKILGRKTAFPPTIKVFDRLLSSCQLTEPALNQLFSKKAATKPHKADILRQQVMQEATQLRQRLEVLNDQAFQSS